MGVSLVCQGTGTILAAVLAAWLTNLMITKFNWNNILAVIIAVISFLSIIISIPIAGIR